MMDETETDDPSIVGDEAHIVAKEIGGPRGNSPLTAEERDHFDNLILLCKVHHKLIDDQPGTYTVEALHGMKDMHLRWVSETLIIDSVKQRDEETYALYIDKWTEFVQLDDWINWTSFVMAPGQPQIRKDVYTGLRNCGQFLLSRIWPRRFPDLESALSNFGLVLQDLLNTFDRHGVESHHDNMFETEKFYKLRQHTEERYNELLRKYNYHVDLVEDLMLELTRGANYVCDKVRATISPSYRLAEGVLLVFSGPHQDLLLHTLRVEYVAAERIDRPYPGLREYMTLRSSRDVHFGSGIDEGYFPQLFIE